MALSATIAALLAGRTVRCAHLVEFCFDGQARRLWNGNYKITTGGHDWFGERKLGAIDGIEGGSGDLAAAQLKITMSGVDDRLLAMAVSANRAGYVGEIAKAFYQFFDEDWQVLDDPVACAAGIIDGVETSRSQAENGTTRTVSVTATNIFYGRGLPPASFFTNADQQQRFPGDRGLSYLSEIININIPFPW
jgi:hypothetical protein